MTEGLQICDGRNGPPPPEAMELLRAYPARMGITRIADITGLDMIGIPVVQAVRPLALSNAVSQGKGRDCASAALSALLEAAETFFAERVSNFDTASASADDLGITAEAFENHLLPGVPPAWRHEKLPWMEVRDLVSGDPGWVPLELVHTAYVHPPLETDGIFLASTTGLAAALMQSDAILHGLLECVEREALGRAHRTHGFFHRSKIDMATIDHPEIRGLIDDIAGKGVMVGLWAIDGAGGLPVVWCQLMEDGSRPAIMPYPADGHAASLDPCSAIMRAVMEAAQSRLAAISGSRDDMTRASYPRHTDWQAIEAHRRLIADGPAEIDFRHLAGSGEADGQDWLDAIIRRLPDDGIYSILAVDIDTGPLDELSVVRVVVPQFRPLAEDR